MFHAFSALKDVPNSNPFSALFLPELNPYKLALLALGFFTSLLVNIKLWAKVKEPGNSRQSMRSFMHRVILILTFMDMIAASVPFCCILLYWKYFCYSFPQFPLVRIFFFA